MGDFLAMGGYAQYVWPSYVLFLLMLVLFVVLPGYRRKKLREVSRYEDAMDTEDDTQT